MDTWKNGVGPNKQASWEGWNGQKVYAQEDSQGRIWWPFLDMSLTKRHDFDNLWDWQVSDGVFYDPTGQLSSFSSGNMGMVSYSGAVPVPGSLWLFSSGLVGVFFWRRKKVS